MPTNRFYCNVLHECRVALGKLSIFNLWFFKKQFAMLLEELQGHGNRMEAALEDKRDLHRYHDEAKKVHVELKALPDFSTQLSTYNVITLFTQPIAT